MRFLCSACLLLTIATTARATDTPLERSAVHKAVAKSIAWLEKDMLTWREEHGCAACHHGPMYLWSIGVARRQGYDVNESELKEFTNWLLTDDEARIFPKTVTGKPAASNNTSDSDRMTATMMGHRNLSQPTIYLTHALNALPDEEPLRVAGWQKVIEHLASAQIDDGSFAGRNAWRPIFNTPQILTLFVVAGLRDRANSDPAAATPAKMKHSLLKQAEAFLEQQTPDESHQGLVLRLLAERDQRIRPAGADRPANVIHIVDRLMGLQRPDGGWSQTNDRESDAFATGQSITALSRAGISTTDAAIRRGIDYLLRTQNADGTWPMTSRPNPETGKPAEFVNPITYAATAWATLGLTNCVPGK